MFDRKRSQMSVRDDIAMRTGKREKFAQNLRVPFGRQRYPCRLAREPCLYLPPRISNGFGIFEYPRISHKPQEGQHAGPRETDRTGTVQLLIKPVARYRVLSKSRHKACDVLMSRTCPTKQ